MSDQVRVRFVVSDAGGDSNVEAAVDGFLVGELLCDACESDINGDGQSDVGDLLIILADWGVCGLNCPADIDGSGAVDVGDILVLLAAWGGCS